MPAQGPLPLRSSVGFGTGQPPDANGSVGLVCAIADDLRIDQDTSTPGLDGPSQLQALSLGGFRDQPLHPLQQGLVAEAVVEPLLQQGKRQLARPSGAVTQPL